MTRPSLEKLMAYADGALDASEAREIERYLETDREARQMVTDFARTDDYLRRAFEAPLLGSPPQALIDTIMNAKVEAPPEASNVVRLPERQSKQLLQRPLVSSLMAASVAFVMGGALGYFTSGSLSNVNSAHLVGVGTIAKNSEIAVLLTRSASGGRIPIKARGGDEAHVTITSSFRDGKGRVCREFEAESGQAGSTIAAIACRQPQGPWVVEGASRIASTTSDPNSYVPSSSIAHEPLAGVLTMLSAGKALSPAEELTILREWENQERE